MASCSREYQLSERAPAAAGSAADYQAPNRAQGFRTIFGHDGVRVIPRDVPQDEAPAWEWQLTLAGWGRDGSPAEPAGTPERIVNGNRIEYRRGDLTEWYVNDAQGLEQGFTIARRPGSDEMPDAPNVVRVELAVASSLESGSGRSTSPTPDTGALNRARTKSSSLLPSTRIRPSACTATCVIRELAEPSSKI